MNIDTGSVSDSREVAGAELAQVDAGDELGATFGVELGAGAMTERVNTAGRGDELAPPRAAAVVIDRDAPARVRLVMVPRATSRPWAYR